MRKIAVLDQHTIDKIAAGEVVERPSSVVKELVENAIDAGATAVTVEITDGGKKLIRITDNGGGMEAEQVPLAFLRHATSKLEKIEDLEHIASLGFRGEALSSIAAVSQVELITKTPSSLSGVRYIIEGGKEHSLEELGAPEGTTFLVRNLFYNTPARSKFLKSDATEGNYISILMEQLALSHPEISFKYIQNKQVKLHTSGNYSVKDVIYSIYGRDITKALLPVSYENDFMKITGFAGKPEISRGNRTFENYYINGRYVKNNIITKAIEDAYKGFLMQHKFPFVSLHMEMDGNDLDVNVHPAKREVRFARGPEVYDGVYETIRKALTHREMIPKVSFGKEESASFVKETVKRGDVPEPFEVKRREQSYAGVRPDPGMVRDRAGYTAIPKGPAFSKEEETLFTGTLRQAAAEADAAKGKAADVQRNEVIAQRNEAAAQRNEVGENSSAAAEAVPVLENEKADRENTIYSSMQEKAAGETKNHFQTYFPEQESRNYGETVSLSGLYTAQKSAVDAEPPKGDSVIGNAAIGNPAVENPTIENAAIENPTIENAAIENPAIGNVAIENAAITNPATGNAAIENSAITNPVIDNSAAGTPSISAGEQLELFEEKLLAPESRNRHQLIGQLFDTYWLVQFGNDFYIIDQHAAHEKVFYERLVKQFQEQTIESQYVSPPMIVTLNLQEEALLKANESYFRDFGFEIEPFGGKEYCISAVPSNLYGFAEEELFLDMLDHLGADGDKNALKLFTSRLATMACKAAVKGNHKMSPQEADKLIDELLTLENPYHCPHGRPTIISMSKAELEKKFKRIV